jgi:hypothetical protein
MVEPRFQRQLFRAIVVAKRPGDDLVHDLGGRETVLGVGNLLIGAAEIEFPVHETLEP